MYKRQGINITSGSTLNTISGGTIKGITISGTLGTITGGTFDFSTYTASNYGTIKNYIASGKAARLDSTLSLIHISAMIQDTFTMLK